MSDVAIGLKRSQLRHAEPGASTDELKRKLYDELMAEDHPEEWFRRRPW